MRIAVFGLGYVGVVSAACLADQGHEIIGVELNPAKVDLVNAGHSPIVEPQLEELLTRAVRSGALRATTDWAGAVADTEMAWLCVGTPSLPDGGLDVSHLVDVCREIGEAIRDRDHHYTVVVRSTALPGTTRRLLAPAIERECGRAMGDGWGMCYHPEFLREGSSVGDFASPSLIVIGASDAMSGELLTSLCSAAPVRCSIEEAEMVKYAANSWHGTKVAFANEIGTVAKASGLDGRRVMEIFLMDRKLNVSEAYLRPGFAFGGSCLPKDLRALTSEGKRLGLELPLLDSVLRSNQRHIDRAVALIADSGARQVGLAGLSFKPGTDDLRESPLLDLAARLISQGLHLKIYDPGLDVARVAGANLEYLESRLPDAGRLMVGSLAELVREAELVVIGHLDAAGRSGLAGLLGECGVLDLAGVVGPGRREGDYQGICW